MSDTSAIVLGKIKEDLDNQLKELDLSCWYSRRETLTQIPNEIFELEHLEKLSLRYKKSICQKNLNTIQRLK